MTSRAKSDQATPESPAPRWAPGEKESAVSRLLRRYHPGMTVREIVRTCAQRDGVTLTAQAIQYYARPRAGGVSLAPTKVGELARAVQVPEGEVLQALLLDAGFPPELVFGKPGEPGEQTPDEAELLANFRRCGPSDQQVVEYLAARLSNG